MLKYENASSMHIVFGATELGASAAANAASSPRGRFQLDSLIRLFHAVSCANRDGSHGLFQVKTGSCCAPPRSASCARYAQ